MGAEQLPCSVETVAQRTNSLGPRKKKSLGEAGYHKESEGQTYQAGETYSSPGLGMKVDSSGSGKRKHFPGWEEPGVTPKAHVWESMAPTCNRAIDHSWHYFGSMEAVL